MLQRNRRLSLLLFTLLQRTWKCCWVISEKIPAPRPRISSERRKKRVFLWLLLKMLYMLHILKGLFAFLHFYVCEHVFVCVCVSWIHVCLYVCVMRVSCAGACPSACPQKTSVLFMYSFDFDAVSFPECGASISSSGVEFSKPQPSSRLCPSWNGG